VKRCLAFLRAFLRDPGGDYNLYTLLAALAAAITAVVIRAYRDEIRAALADAIRAVSGLLGVWR
jgi:uncharacterized membrane protein